MPLFRKNLQKYEQADSKTIPIKPPLKWAGGKRWLIPYLKPVWNRYSKCRLVEPLCGGLAVSLGLRPEKALLNDINNHAINFYRWVKAGLTIDIPMENDNELFYRHREQFNQLIQQGRGTEKKAAELFYYLNKTGYNGLCRFNKKGEFNVPFGRYKKINYADDFYKYREVFADWQFMTADFEQVPLEPGDFIYADPPYDVEFTQYSKGGFSWHDQIRLAEWLAKHNGPVILSNQATDRVIELYAEFGFTLHYVDAPRMISCNGDRTKAREIVAVRGCLV